MDAAPSFGVSMISEVPSNPQLTLALGVSIPYSVRAKCSHFCSYTFSIYRAGCTYFILGGAKPKNFGGAKYTLQFFSYLFIFNAFLLLSFFNHPKILKIDDCYSKS